MQRRIRPTGSNGFFTLITAFRLSTHEFELHVIALGTEVAFAAIPGEPYSQIGEAVKDRSPFEMTLFSGYTNTGWNYIPTEEAYDEGGFIVEITPFDRTAADVVVSESVDLLEELYPTP